MEKSICDDISTSSIFMYSPRYPLPVAIYYECVAALMGVVTESNEV